MSRKAAFLSFAFLTGFVVSSPAHCQDAARRVGLDPAKLSAVRARMEEFVARAEIAGAVTLVGRRGEIASLEAVGFQDIEARAPMKADAIFRIASMTKPITAIGIMILEDEGKLSTDDPVEKHLPEFKGQMVVKERSGETVTLAKPSRPITLRDLLTHTSGLPGGPPPGLGDLYKRRDRTLAEMAMASSQRPLEFEPGSKWSYCNAGIDALGRVIEVVSGRSYENFLAERVFAPLGMADTAFYMAPEKLARLAPVYERKDGRLSRVESFLGGEAGGKHPIPAGGLFSTATDLARLYQMMLRRGVYDGKRILSEASVEKMTRLHTGDLKSGFTDGMGFGLGWAVVREPRGVTEMLTAGSYGHGGAYGTQAWIDPKAQMFLVLLIQRAGLPNADASDIRKAFQATAVAAIVE